MQQPQATRVAGFRAWLKLGYCVRKGETALRIWCPCPPSAKQLKEWLLGLPVDGFAIPYLTSWSEGSDLIVIERAADMIDRLAKRIEDAADISAPGNNLRGPVYTQ